MVLMVTRRVAARHSLRRQSAFSAQRGTFAHSPLRGSQEVLADCEFKFEFGLENRFAEARREHSLGPFLDAEGCDDSRVAA
jgi:hypothetical protein